MLVRVTKGNVVAGIELQHDIVVRAAPILRWTIGRHRDDVRAAFERKGWKASIIESDPTKKGDSDENHDHNLVGAGRLDVTRRRLRAAAEASPRRTRKVDD